MLRGEGSRIDIARLALAVYSTFCCCVSAFALEIMETVGEAQRPFLAACESAAGQSFFQEDNDNFRSIRDNKPRSLCLTETVLEHTDAHGVPSVLHLSNVLGAKASRAVGAGVAGAYLLEVFAYVPNEGSVGCTKGVCRQKKRQAGHLKWHTTNEDTAQSWATTINDILKRTTATPTATATAAPQCQRQTTGVSGGVDGGGGGSCGTFVSGAGSSSGSRIASGPGRRLLVLVNPVSGTGSSRKIWEETLRPMLEQAMTDITPVISTRGGELAEVVRYAGHHGAHIPEEKKDGNGGAGGLAGRGRPGKRGESVVDVGSLDNFDGIVVVGGDGTLFEILQGIYAREDCERQLSRLALGVVPTGTGNGLAKTISEESGEVFGAVAASFLAAKGCTAKMDLLHTEAGDKKYLAFLNVGWGMVSDVDIESEAYRWLGSLRFTVGTVFRIIGLRHYRGRISFLPACLDADGSPAASAHSAPSGAFRMPLLSEAVSENGVEGVGGNEWITVEGEFVLGDIARVKYISHDMPMAPASRLDDGLMDLFFVRRGAGRMSITKMFLKMEKGEHTSLPHPFLEWHRVRAFRIEPLSSRGKLTVDGELVDYAPLQQHIWPKAANILGSCSRGGGGGPGSPPTVDHTGVAGEGLGCN